LQRIADLLFEGKTVYTGEWLCLFEELLSCLVGYIDRSAKIYFSGRMSSARTVLPKLLRQLVLDDVVDVAAPVLANCQSAL
jgi:hypothetical protein